MPGRLVFSTTADGAASPTERLRISNAGQIAVAGAGTAAAPVITKNDDLNTGIFFPAADTIAFAEGGSEAARIDSSGRLLVGTSSAPTGSKASSLTVNEQLLVSTGLGIYSGAGGTISATTGTIVFTFTNTTVNARAAMVKIGIATRVANNTPSNSPCAEYQFQLFKDGLIACSLNGAASIYEFTFVRATHFAFADLGSGVCEVTLTNPTAQTLASQYKVEILSGDTTLTWTLTSVTTT
jgi:hypothetical protein